MNDDGGAERKNGARSQRASVTDRAPGLFGGNRVLRLLVLFLAGLNCALMYGLFFSGQGIWAFRQQNAHVEELEAKVMKLQKENQKLYRKIQAFKNDPEAQERLVRQQLGWVRGNELVVEFTPTEADVQD